MNAETGPRRVVLGTLLDNRHRGCHTCCRCPERVKWPEHRLPWRCMWTCSLLPPPRDYPVDKWHGILNFIDGHSGTCPAWEKA